MSDFEPKNELEYLMLGAKNGIVSVPVVYLSLLLSPVVILCNKEWDGRTPDPDLQALMFTDNNTGLRISVMFSDEERSERMREKYEGYSYPVTVSAAAMMQTMKDDMGFVINPGMEVSMQVEPEGVQQLIETFGTAPPGQPPEVAAPDGGPVFNA
ncbi:MAG: SseB family protein [Gammaproteobacteria bacterium]|nr:SseB family protein [Gammaproteobacteria bacterium]